MQKRPQYTLCTMNALFVQAPDGSTWTQKNLKVNPTVRSVLTDHYSQTDPACFQTDLSTVHLSFAYSQTLLLLLYLIMNILLLPSGPLSKDPYTHSCFQYSPLHSLLIPHNTLL